MFQRLPNTKHLPVLEQSVRNDALQVLYILVWRWALDGGIRVKEDGRIKVDYLQQAFLRVPQYIFRFDVHVGDIMIVEFGYGCEKLGKDVNIRAFRVHVAHTISSI